MTNIKPYGDSFNDGKVQLSFTLPLPSGRKARETARLITKEMGFDDVNIVEMRDLGEGFSFFVVYGSLQISFNFDDININEISTEVMDYYQINKYIKTKIGRQITVVGACTGSDAHTMGLDAILNMKGYKGEYGLERYPLINTYNLGSQVPNEELIQSALQVKADAILVSQVVTQRNIHITNLTELIELLEAEGLREKFILVVGGPRIDHKFAHEMGFDAGFGKDTLPPEVATFLAKRIVGET